MPRRKALAALLLAAGAAGAAVYRLRAGLSDERIELYYEDGSTIALADGHPEGQRLLPFARDILSTVGP